jgi:histidyl-tRNA synthetase
VPTTVLVAVADEAHRAVSEAVAGVLRARGIATEVAPRADKYGKQIRYADRRGIPYVWFPTHPDQAQEAGGPVADSVKDLHTGNQEAAQADTWSPDPTAMRPTVEPVDPAAPDRAPGAPQATQITAAN